MKIIISQVYKNINEISNDIFRIQKKIDNINKLYDNYALIIKYKIELIDEDVNNVYNSLINNYKKINEYVLDYADIVEDVQTIYVQRKKDLLLEKQEQCIEIYSKINDIFNNYKIVDTFVNDVMKTFGSELNDMLLLEEINNNDCVFVSLNDINKDDDDDYCFF